jgi:hypothetical protein
MKYQKDRLTIFFGRDIKCLNINSSTKKEEE